MGLGTLILLILGVAWYVRCVIKYIKWDSSYMVDFATWFTFWGGSAVLAFTVFYLLIPLLNQIRI